MESFKLYWDSNGALATLPANLIFDMDDGPNGDLSVQLAAWQSGSGHADYKILVPEEYFLAAAGDGLTAGKYIYLYSEFSNANSGFEEWSVGPAEGGPAISINKVTSDGETTGDGIFVDAGEAITWTYTVTNTGNVALSGVTVTDNQGVIATYQSGDTNNIGQLDTDETWVFTANGFAINGSYSNIGTASGTYLGETVTASDPSSYTGVQQGQDLNSIEIEKTTNGTDGPTVLVGSTVTWTYAVHNNGVDDPGDIGVPDLDNIVVTDDGGPGPGFVATAVLGADLVHNIGDLNLDGVLNADVFGTGIDESETWLFQYTGIATAGLYENIGSVTSEVVGEDDGPGANDESSYFGASPQIAIVKQTQDLHDPDGSRSDGDFILVGHEIQWIYTVTNSGNVALAGVTVTDVNSEGDTVTPVLQAVDIGEGTGDLDGDGYLDLNETWVYTATGVAIAGLYENTGTATATGFVDTTPAIPDDDVEVVVALAPDDRPTASEDSSYFGAAPDIDVEKFVSVDGGATWHDADTAPGPVLTDVSPFDPIFKFVVHNTGNVALTNITLDDNVFDLSGLVGPGLTASGNNIVIASLAADDSVDGSGADEIELTITVPWASGQHTNIATVSATYEDTAEHPTTVDDNDAANYLGFDVGRHGLTKGYWGQHLEAWDGESTNAPAPKKGYDTNRWDKNVGDNNDLSHKDMLLFETTPGSGVYIRKDSNGDGVINAGDIGVLLGDKDGDGVNFNDTNGNGIKDGTESIVDTNTLFVSLAAAQQIILSSDSANDTRQILMSQALAAQLNINNGDKDPLDLIGEAVSWLKGQAPYQYNDNLTDAANGAKDSTGKVDTNGDGILSVGNNNTFEYNTTTKAFTGDGNGSSLAGTALTSNLHAWQLDVRVYDPAPGSIPIPGTDPVKYFDGTANGEELKNALEYFNQDKLITSADGAYVAWTDDHGLTVESVLANTIDQFWLTLADQDKVI